MATDEKEQVDAEKTKEIRQLMAEGGDAAVQHKFGEDVTDSAEYQRAQKQREAVRKRQETMRRKAAKEASANTKTAAGAGSKPSDRITNSAGSKGAERAGNKPAGRGPKAREQTLERRRQLKEQEKSKDTLSR